MNRREKRKLALLNWRLRLQASGIYRLSAIPDSRRDGTSPPLPGLAPESALRLHPCRALPSAPASTRIRAQRSLAKRVVVADREK